MHFFLVDNDGENALHCAVYCDNIEGFNLLLKAPNIRVDINIVEWCKEGDLEGVKVALQSGADVNAKRFGPSSVDLT